MARRQWKIVPVGRMFGSGCGPCVLPDEPDVLEDEREPDRRDERHEPRLVTERLVADALDRNVDDHAEEHREEETREDRVDLLSRRRVGRRRCPEWDREDERRGEEGDLEGPGVDDPVRLERPEHEVVPVGEVDQLDDSVDERVAQRDERVDRAVRDPDQRDFEEAVRRLDRVLDQPVADAGRENGPHGPKDDLRDREATLEGWSRCGVSSRHRRRL